MAKQRPTRRQLEVLRACIRAGSAAAAAYELGISETTVRQHLSGLYRRTGCLKRGAGGVLVGQGYRRLRSDKSLGLLLQDEIELQVATTRTASLDRAGRQRPQLDDRARALSTLQRAVGGVTRSGDARG